MTLYWYRSHCFYHVNCVIVNLTLTSEKHKGLYQNRVTDSLAFIHRPGNLATTVKRTIIHAMRNYTYVNNYQLRSEINTKTSQEVARDFYSRSLWFDFKAVQSWFFKVDVSRDAVDLVLSL